MCLNISIIFLQEILITDDYIIRLLDFIAETYFALDVGGIFSYKLISSTTGRPMGGLVCIYKNYSNVKYLYLVLGIIVISVNMEIVLINIYIRSDLGELFTQVDYINNLFEIEAFNY